MFKIIVLLICAVAIAVYFLPRAKYSIFWAGPKNTYWGIKVFKPLQIIGLIVLFLGVIVILYLLLTGIK